MFKHTYVGFIFIFFSVGLDSLHKIVLPYAAVKWLANVFSAINPYIYLSFNDRFRVHDHHEEIL